MEGGQKPVKKRPAGTVAGAAQAKRFEDKSSSKPKLCRV